MTDLTALITRSETEATLSPLSDHAVLRITGDDAQTFLHGQFVSDVNALALGHGQLTAWCSPQGRVAYLLHLVRISDAYFVLLPASEAVRFVKRLRMFVLRAKVTIDELPQYRVYGLQNLALGALPLVLPQVQRCVEFDTGCYALGIEHGRYLLWGEATAMACTAQRPELAAMPIEIWQYADITRGYPEIAGNNADTFLPQQLNLDLLDVVSFTKGCYPGQEVVARLKYRGEVKSRLMWCESSRVCAPGTKILLDGVSASAGQVLRSLQITADRAVMQVVVDIACVAEGASHTADGDRLNLRWPPYYPAIAR